MDGYPDIFVANDAVPDFLYRNNRDGTFTDVAVTAGVRLQFQRGRATASMGIASGDYDNDGVSDIFRYKTSPWKLTASFTTTATAFIQ